MKLIKCANGHFYDAERYDQCPHCNAAPGGGDQVTRPAAPTPANDAVTTDMSGGVIAPATSYQPSGSPSLKDAVRQASGGPGIAVGGGDDEKTVSFYKRSMGTEPVVGWLVCVEGAHFGEDFRLKSGRNFIGRAPSMDVAISKDSSVSREKHAVVVYEPKNHIFLVQPGDSKELCYLNDDVVLSAEKLKLNDLLTVGETKLMFVPCCGDQFNWEMQKKDSAE
ncbi:FHA domain-containing protein [Oscillospiraceae bacterium OttesenSCG-928-F05]|nr:FHA domain-containing protein [Oscillospiraceae bacterium OttesenSCG-928-F05]